VRSSVTTAPASDPVTVEEAKDHCLITHGTDDAYVEALIKAATAHVENDLSRSLVTQTRTLYLDAREAVPPIVLPWGPVQSVTTLKVYNTTTKVWDTVAATSYDLSGDRIVPDENDDATDWPTLGRARDAVEVVYVCGYGAASAVPRILKQAVLTLVADMYENRESIVEKALHRVPMIERFLEPYRNYQFG
jgi:uncharacterized phiE125 gp8 family phage protein